MAITSLVVRTFLNPASPTIQIAGNALVAIAASSSTAQPNFRYVFRVQNIAGSFNFGFFKADPVPTFTIFAYPDVGTPNGFVHLEKALQAAFEGGFFCPITTTYLPFSVNVYPNATNRVNIICQEEYGSPPAIQAPTTTATINIINGGWDQAKYDSVNPNEYAIDGNTAAKRRLANEPITTDLVTYGVNYPRIISKQYPWSLRYFCFYAVPALGNWRWRARYYNTAGTILRDFIGATINEGAFTIPRLITIPVGLAQIWSNTTTMSDSLPMNNQINTLSANGGAIEIWVENTSGAPLSPRAYYQIDPCPVRYNAVELHWVNENGGIDSFTFVGKNRRSANIKRQFLSRNQNGFMTKVDKEVVNAQHVFEYDLNTDWLNDDEFAYLFGAFKARKMWLVNYGANPTQSTATPFNPISVNVEVNSYRFFERVTDKLKSLSVRVTGATLNNNV